MKEVLVVKPRGFCAGVVRAIDIVELAIERFGTPVYMKHAIVHNPSVVEDLEAKGATFVETVEEIPEGATVVFSAHGSPPEDFVVAEARQLKVIDATCPLVTRVHNEALKYGKEGRPIIIIGHRGHVEMEGSLGQAAAATDNVYALDPEKGGEPFAEGGATHRRLGGEKPPVVLTQTTLSQDDVRPAVELVQAAFPDALIRNDICFATTNRQTAVKRLAEEVDVVIVVGSHTSSNSTRLAEAARRAGCQAVLVNSGDAIPWFLLLNAQKVGVSSGASTPDHLVEEVVRTLEEGGFVRRELEVVIEDVSFKMPGELVGAGTP